jgi:acetyl esterase/lipase
MNSRHLVDPQLLPALDMLPNFELSPESLALMREGMLSAAASGPQLELPGIERREHFVPGPAGAPNVRVLSYTHRTGQGRPAYLHFHGGGYVLGSADIGDTSCKSMAETLGCVIVTVDYRLAPETIFPGNVEDCYAALRWLHEHASEIGADPSRIAIGGESAGGGLAAALALLARDRGEVPIIHQQLIYPMLDDRSHDSSHPYAGEFVWTRGHSRFGWTSLLGHPPGRADVSPYAAAARAENVEGLPPAFISVGALDLFLEENLEYARRLTRAGVPVELHVYPGVFHGADMVAEARLTKKHARDQLEALRAAFALA